MERSVLAVAERPEASARGVIFVCLGNICRSPTGEGVLRQLVAAQGLEAQIPVESAGTLEHMVGAPRDARMRAAAARRGYLLEGRAQTFCSPDFERFALIVAMDRANLEVLYALDPQARYRDKTRLLSSFLPAGTPLDVPDPYRGGAEGFERVLDLIEAACPVILRQLLPER
ncbi:MAG: low molecular weight phosphotyrosine protein phosphatase [Proteobacteria bacterium]|nr:low molecular weight phosphotyrosine protein phosphatase [Pseudomonadota bacterium]